MLYQSRTPSGLSAFLLERRIRQDPALRGRLDSKGRDGYVEVAADDPVVNVVGVDIE
jgi:hypothetical protein